MKKLLALTLLALSTGLLVAQTQAPVVSATVASPASKEMSEAEVRKVDKEAKKVTLKHGPIKNLDMPGMTMVFQVRDEKLFGKLIAGEKIKFSAEQLQGAFVVTEVEKVDAK
jgi:Cu(I)/Ag(I) efflux system periplasmic protein CusF